MNVKQCCQSAIRRGIETAVTHRYAIIDQSGEDNVGVNSGYSPRPSIRGDLSSKVALFSLKEEISLVAIASDFSASR